MLLNYSREWLASSRHEVKMDKSSCIVDHANCSFGNETIIVFINLTTVSDVTIILHATFVSIIIVLGLIGNSVVLILVCKDKRLRHKSIIASLNIVSVDTLLTIFYHGVILTNTLTRRWSDCEEDDTAEAQCKLLGILTTFLINVRWVTIGLLTLDRFLTVRFPFRYARYNCQFLIFASILSWLIPSGFSGLLAVPIVGYSLRANIPTCLPTCINVDHPFFCTLLNTGVIIIMFIIGCLLPTFMYTWMIFKARKLQVKYTIGKLVTSISANVSYTETVYNREKRAMVTILLIFLTILLTSIPSFLLLLLRQINICIFFQIPTEVHFIVTDTFIVSTLLDPIVLMRNQDFRTVLSELFRVNSLNRCHHVSDGKPPVQVPQLTDTINNSETNCTSLGETTNGGSLSSESYL